MSQEQRFSDDRLKAAHDLSIFNRKQIEASESYGCFHCRRFGPVSEILDWADDGDTPLCPRCGIDAIIGSASGFPVTNLRFLGEMKRRWF